MKRVRLNLRLFEGEGGEAGAGSSAEQTGENVQNTTGSDAAEESHEENAGRTESGI